LCSSYFIFHITRCIAGTDKWEATKDIKSKLDEAEYLFNRHIKEHIGYGAPLMMPGNYARMLFEEKNEAIILELVSD
jgi:hypothetical protein